MNTNLKSMKKATHASHTSAQLHAGHKKNIIYANIQIIMDEMLNKEVAFQHSFI